MQVPAAHESVKVLLALVLNWSTEALFFKAKLSQNLSPYLASPCAFDPGIMKFHKLAFAALLLPCSYCNAAQQRIGRVDNSNAADIVGDIVDKTPVSARVPGYVYIESVTNPNGDRGVTCGGQLIHPDIVVRMNEGQQELRSSHEVIIT